MHDRRRTPRSHPVLLHGFAGGYRAPIWRRHSLWRKYRASKSKSQDQAYRSLRAQRVSVSNPTSGEVIPVSIQAPPGPNRTIVVSALTAATPPRRIFSGTLSGVSLTPGPPVDLEVVLVPVFTVTVQKQGIGSGTITSTPLGIDCGTTCSGEFEQGTMVSFNAAATTPGSVFVGWSGGACSGAVPTCTVVINANQTVTATFTVPNTNWKLKFVDSEETVGSDGRGVNGFDGNTGTIWHTQWVNAAPPPPHEIQINLGSSANLNGFVYVPRQDSSPNGRIGQYEFYVSTDGVNWGSPVATGTFANDATNKQVSFASKTGQYVRLRALSEVNGLPYTSMAELQVLNTTGAIRRRMGSSQIRRELIGLISGNKTPQPNPSQ